VMNAVEAGGMVNCQELCPEAATLVRVRVP